ncbi:MAG: putative aromatic amino acid decarboxylase [Acidimicrobiales bacterium]|nr:putative aromatic amino acid decarboxylase [Acidimicrobiales bacterium]
MRSPIADRSRLDSFWNVDRVVNGVPAAAGAPEPDADRSYAMSADEFRRWGHEAVEWVARYLERVEDLPVGSTVAPGEIRALLPPSPPEQPEPFGAVLADLDRVVLPGITHWQSPKWFGYFQANASGPSIIGELIAAGLGTQGMLWSTSPAATELETHVLDWLVELLGLPDRFRSDGPGGGVIQDGASGATLCALLAARERAGWRDRLDRLVAYSSPEAHSSVLKGARVAGLHDDQLRLVATDEHQAMRADAFAAAVAEDRERGRVPFFAVATVGTTSTHALDPVPELAAVCREAGIWLHVDGAHAGSAAVAPELRFVNAGLDQVDSYCFDPHKWLFTNLECDVLYVADRAPLLAALSVLPEYLRNAATESGAVIDYRDWHLALGRRFRALKLWFVLRHYGAEGLRSTIRSHVRWAAELATWIAADPRFELVAPVPLNLVCFRHLGGDAVNQRLMDDLNASGELYLTHTRVDGRLALRMSIGQTATERRHVVDAWELIATRADQAAAAAGAAPDPRPGARR